MTQLREDRTYRTRDGSRTGIRVERQNVKGWPWKRVGAEELPTDSYTHDGRWRPSGNDDPFDLIEETSEPAPQPFSFAACPVDPDNPSRRRAVTRDGREVVLVTDQGPAWPFVGWIVDEHRATSWRADGKLSEIDDSDLPSDLLIPPPKKRTVWAVPAEYKNYDGTWTPFLFAFNTKESAEQHKFDKPMRRLGNRAYPIEIDGGPA